jgi:phosphoribosylformylglycinamidine synthase PurS subunit
LFCFFDLGCKIRVFQPARNRYLHNSPCGTCAHCQRPIAGFRTKPASVDAKPAGNGTCKVVSRAAGGYGVTRKRSSARGAISRGMVSMKARVTVTLKNGVLDPQGKAIEGALKSLDIAGVNSVRQGKVFDIEIDAADADAARATLEQACEKLLANTVIENYRVELV